MNLARYLFAFLLPVFLGSGSALAGGTDTFLSPASQEQLLVPRFADGLNATPPVNRTELDLAGFFGNAIRDWGVDHFSVPVLLEERRVDAQRSLLMNALSVQWQHSLNASHVMTLSAQHGDYTYSDTPLSAGTNTSAALSWSRLFGGDSRVTGQFFVGDEGNRDRSSSYFARRYYGLLVEGHYMLWPEHAPFASLSWQHSDYDVTDGGLASVALTTRHDSSSRVAAGWNWQVQPNWGVRAEANYRFSDGALDLNESDRTHFYFSTRYGFR
jgi:hypothetical protein